MSLVSHVCILSLKVTESSVWAKDSEIGQSSSVHVWPERPDVAASLGASGPNKKGDLVSQTPRVLLRLACSQSLDPKVG